MSYERGGGVSLDYQLCAYPGSRLQFRGPVCAQDAPYLAFMGSTEVFGKCVTRSLPQRVEDRLGLPCANLGVVNAGPDAFLNDLGALSVAARAEAVVLHVMGVQYLSNRFYTVHPRRNDRFLHPSEMMRRLFPEVDFTQFHFVNHLLRHLRCHARDRFALVLKELQTAWRARMRQLTWYLGGPVLLLWLADHAPDEKLGLSDGASRPFGVTAAMLEALRCEVEEVVICCASPAALARGAEGMAFSAAERGQEEHLFGPFVFEEAAELLEAALGRFRR